MLRYPRSQLDINYEMPSCKIDIVLRVPQASQPLPCFQQLRCYFCCHLSPLQLEMRASKHVGGTVRVMAPRDPLFREDGMRTTSLPVLVLYLLEHFCHSLMGSKRQITTS